MKKILTLFAILVHVEMWAQTDTVLERYLLAHRAAIVKNDSALSLTPEARSIIFSRLKDKNLLVLAENTSHELEMYEYLRPAIIEQLNEIHLKYVFMEWGRCNAYSLNASLDGTYRLTDRNFYNETETQCLSRLFGGKRTFEFKGIDFERGIQFNLAMNNLFYDVDVHKLDGSKEYVTWLKDFASINFPPDSNTKAYYFHFHDFYKTATKRFYKDSAIIKRELPSKYNELKYLVTNINNDLPPPWTKPRLLNYQRDNELKRNLLSEIGTLDTSAKYFLGIGLQHARQKKRQMVYKLEHTNALKNRIAIINEYCEHCNVDSVEAPNEDLKFLKGAVLATFSKAADSDIVLFDLSQLPESYAYIKKQGDMLIFAKRQE